MSTKLLNLLFLLVLFSSLYAESVNETLPIEDTSKTITGTDKEKLISDAKVKLEISKLTQLALGHIRAKEWKNAEAVTKQILDYSEVSVDYFYLKGNLHYCYGEYQTAIEHINTALKINTSHEPSYFLMGMIYGKRNEWDKSVYYFEKASQYGSYNPYYRMNLAIAQYQVENYGKAIIEARKTLELKENYSFAKIVLIKSLMKTNIKDAWYFVQDQIEKKLDEAIIYPLYIQLLFEYKKNYTELIKELGKKTNLTVIEKRYLAYSYFKENDLVKSINYFKQILNFEKDLDEDQDTYLKILILQNKDADAERYLISLIKHNPTKKKYYIDLFQNLLDKREISKGLYQPIIVR